MMSVWASQHVSIAQERLEHSVLTTGVKVLQRGKSVGHDVKTNVSEVSGGSGPGEFRGRKSAGLDEDSNVQVGVLFDSDRSTKLSCAIGQPDWKRDMY